MPAFLLLLTLPMVGPDTASTEVEHRSFHAIHEDIRAAFRSEATAKTSRDRATAIHTMCALHREIVAHPLFTKSDTLKSHRAKLWSRLLKVKKQLQSQVARQGTSRSRPPPKRSMIRIAIPPTPTRNSQPILP